MNENEVLALLEAISDLIDEGTSTYRKYAAIGRKAAIRSMDDDDLIDLLDCADIETRMMAYKEFTSRHPYLLDMIDDD